MAGDLRGCLPASLNGPKALRNKAPLGAFYVLIGPLACPWGAVATGTRAGGWGPPLNRAFCPSPRKSDGFFMAAKSQARECLEAHRIFFAKVFDQGFWSSKHENTVSPAAFSAMNKNGASNRIFPRNGSLGHRGNSAWSMLGGARQYWLWAHDLLPGQPSAARNRCPEHIRTGCSALGARVLGQAFIIGPTPNGPDRNDLE